MAGNADIEEMLKWHNFDTLTDMFYDGNPSMLEAECAAHAMLCHGGLVSALEELVSWVETGDSGSEFLVSAKSAIAKAKGE